ncbi:poly-beta-1,6 N-acetyl-D-glucosamine export porin PgaA [Stenotrophomonas sp. HITSZ_GD]|uniref:poly-beta-1,6 N-acetyl-D-glucosamine export porin PgaA n=1 Tax=Stenotrophomonas sp. HITSZ_GD TaxID=3037248 RepID=UPI00240D6A6F|nr:poly-beta-1,6 N-acetyl-D-glucosamine export porin PgaA [Stenotrophomonas sp. HITSZ_GD]MDG2526459.1 poly-beta-1,6 N-acetyl-D-glucosamine export porin PgaA [Stenotrophomonas sp. HITSZ_GD]
MSTRLALAAATCAALASPAAPCCEVAAGAIEAARARGDWYAALADIERGLACRPGDRDLLRLRVRTLGDIGSNAVAWRMARATPGLLDAQALDQLASKRLARLIGWSEVGRDEAQRRAAARQALQASDAYLRQVAGKDRAAVVRTRLDRLLPLNRLGRHQAVVDEQALLAREGVALPAYLVGAVSDSLMALRRPAEAAALLAPRLDRTAGNATLQVRHAFAALEQEHSEAAIAGLDAYAATQPAWRWDGLHRSRRPNWARYDADLARIQITAYAGDAAAAQAELEALLRHAPANGTLHGALGQAYLMRGWPRRALQRFGVAAMYAPQDLEVAVGRAEALMALRRDREAAATLSRLRETHPGAAPVTRLDRAWMRHLGWQGEAEAAGGASRGAAAERDPLGSRDARYGFALRSPLLADAWRIRAGYAQRRADPHAEPIERRDTHLGLQYAQGAFDASLDRRLARGAVPRAAGLDLEAGWQLDDHWSLAAGYHRNAADASLQALQAGITADRYALALRYQRDALHGLRVGLDRSVYTDGNRRDSLLARYEQPLAHADRWSLAGEAGAYASRASLPDAAYFNPARDGALDIGLRLFQRPWRRYERHFAHRLALSASRYWQDGYGAAWIPAARYEHEWRLAPGRTLRSGMSWARPVYDGARERRLGLDAGFYWEE